MLLIKVAVTFVTFTRGACALADPQTVHDNLVSLLSSVSDVVLVSDATYTATFTPRYNNVEQPTYIVAVKPAQVDDLQIVIRYAVDNDIPILATGGGHGYTTSIGRLEGGIDIDLGRFDAIQIDTVAGTITIGGSVRSGQVASALQEVGMEIPVTQCPCVGFAGATLGGGIGPYSGIYGPLSDSLLSAEIVTSNGTLLNVSESSHSDLFYGIKGAGSNYGVVTSLQYQIYTATNDGRAMNADMEFLGSQNESVWILVQQFAVSQPKELSVGLSIRFSSDPTSKGIIITANFIYAGPQDEGTTLIQPFLDLEPLGVNISTVLWKDIPATANNGAIVKYGCTPGIYYIPYGVNLYQVDVPNLVNVVAYMNESMSTDVALQSASVVWQQYSRYGLQSHTLDSSAFPYRDVVAFVQIDGIGTSADQDPALAQFARITRDLLHNGSGREELSVFVHFAHGDEGPAAWFSAAKLGRLVGLKRVYDPPNLFSWYNPVTWGRNETS